MFLIINNFLHHKNREGLEAMLTYLNIDFTYGSELDVSNDKYKIIYSPANPIDIHKYPNKFYIFGPHFCVLPSDNNKFDSINNNQKNLVFLLLSKWCYDIFNSAFDAIKNALQPVIDQIKAAFGMGGAGLFLFAQL